MTKEERHCLLAALALGLGRAPLSTILSPEDNEFLATIIGGKDWPTIVATLLPLLKKVAREGGGG